MLGRPVFSANDRISVAFVGIGVMGAENLKAAMNQPGDLSLRCGLRLNWDDKRHTVEQESARCWTGSIGAYGSCRRKGGLPARGSSSRIVFAPVRQRHWGPVIRFVMVRIA